MYKIFYFNKAFNRKPNGGEIGVINNSLKETEMTFRELAYAVGEKGCSFTPAVFKNKRRQEEFTEQQLVALDFDCGITFNEIKARADRCGLDLLFAYKTFSWKSDHEKFRIVFAMSGLMKDRITAKTMISIFMRMFSECDKACNDVSRMFFGGTGLLYLAGRKCEIEPYVLFSAFNAFMADEYGERHYNERVRRFYSELGVYIKAGRNTPEVIENEIGGKCTFTVLYNSVCTNSPKLENGVLSEVPVLALPQRRSVERNFNWESLYENCMLFRDFYDGNEYYFYPELFHIATNLCNIEKGKKVFSNIIDSAANLQHSAYHERNWNAVLNTIIKSQYRPRLCNKCIYEGKCNHLQNMIQTAKPSPRDIRITGEQRYYPIEEAEDSLKHNFYKAIKSDDNDVHIIKAQTGIGKTHLYLNFLKNAEEPYIIAVPTHALKDEVYQKALQIGIANIAATPAMPVFSDMLMNKINHMYNIGAGAMVMPYLRQLAECIDKSDEDYNKLNQYLKDCKNINFNGHIVTTHERLLRIHPDSEALANHRIIIDEDILRTMYSTCSVSVRDVKKLADCCMLSPEVRKRVNDILSREGYRKFTSESLIEIDTELVDELNSVYGNVLDLVNSRVVYVHNDTVYYINEKNIPKQKLIILSATANADIYQLFLRDRKIIEYKCKKARYIGRIVQYTNYTYSRCCMRNNAGVMDFLKEKVENDAVITFKEFEETFSTSFHYGNTEGVNMLEGDDISVIGLPNVSDIVYKLYGMIAGVDSNEYSMYPMRIQHNNFDFSLCTFNNEILKAIQIWLIESLLEQAVGRARLLRYDCTVKVFAGFPVEQAELIK